MQRAQVCNKEAGVKVKEDNKFAYKTQIQVCGGTVGAQVCDEKAGVKVKEDNKCVRQDSDTSLYWDVGQ
jgi:hypothetical protein